MTRSFTILAAAALVAPLLVAGPAAAKGDGASDTRKAIAAAKAEARAKNGNDTSGGSFFGTLFGLDDRAEKASADEKAKARKTDE
ncbi:MAG: hypothetical protein AAFP17_01455 [Pseudomonadota bacterium]